MLLHTTTTIIDADTKDVYAYVMMMHDEHLIMTVMPDIKTKNIEINYLFEKHLNLNFWRPSNYFPGHISHCQKFDYTLNK